MKCVSWHNVEELVVLKVTPNSLDATICTMMSLWSVYQCGSTNGPQCSLSIAPHPSTSSPAIQKSIHPFLVPLPIASINLPHPSSSSATLSSLSTSFLPKMFPSSSHSILTHPTPTLPLHSSSSSSSQLHSYTPNYPSFPKHTQTFPFLSTPFPSLPHPSPWRPESKR